MTARSSLALLASGTVMVLALGALAPGRAVAQASSLDIAGASTVTGLEAALGTWVLAMPYGGFWHTEPQAGDGWAILLGLAAGAAHATLSWAIVRGDPERAELVTSVAAGGAAPALVVAMLGGLYSLLTDFDRLAVSLVFGVPVLLAMTVATCVGLAHLLVEGDAPVAMPAPLTTRF